MKDFFNKFNPIYQNEDDDYQKSYKRRYENNMNQSLGELKINNNKIKNDLLKEIQSLKNDVVGNVNVIKGINQNNGKDYRENDLETGV